MGFIKHVKVLSIFLTMAIGIGFFTSCISSPPELVIDREYDDLRENDQDRDTVIDNAQERFPDSKVCEGDDDCEEICDDIFSRRADREDCEELPIKQVERLEIVYEVFEDPDEDNLEKLDLDDLRVLMNISIQPIDRLVEKMSRGEMTNVLFWIARDEDVATIFEKEDQDFAIFKILLEEFDNTDSSSFVPSTALSKTLDSGLNFIEIASEENNSVALEWVHELFEDICSDEDDYEECLFDTNYCAMTFDTDTEEAYFDEEFFERFLDSILEDFRPSSSPPAWWTTDVEADELDSWKSSPNDVCSNADFS